MSKLYNNYVTLKQKDPNKLYAFKSGIFFLFLDEDAKLISRTFHLKLTKLNDTIVKCGFPASHLDKYLLLFEQIPNEVALINLESHILHTPKQYITEKSIQSLILELCMLDTNQMSVSEAFNYLQNLQEKANVIRKEIENG